MQVIVTPLHWWSEANRIAAELHIEVGKAYAVAIGGSQPTRAMVAALRVQLRQLEQALRRGVRMEGGFVQVDEPRAEVPPIATEQAPAPAPGEPGAQRPAGGAAETFNLFAPHSAQGGR